jgi:hypothetical protein
MSRLLLTFDAPGTPDFTQFTATVNAALASVLSSLIGSVQVVLTQHVPNYAREVKLLIDTDTAGTVITHPFLMAAFQADIDVALQAQINAFRAANPGYFWGPVVYNYTDQTSSSPFRSTAFLLYNTSLSDGMANWDPGFVVLSGGGGPPTGAAGGDLSGTYPNPLVGPTTHGQTTTASLAVGANTIDSFPTASVTTATVELTLKKGGTTWYQSTFTMNVNDGTTPAWLESDVVIGPPSGGTFDCPLTATISGGNLNVVCTPATTGWTAEVRARAFS